MFATSIFGSRFAAAAIALALSVATIGGTVTVPVEASAATLSTVA